MTPDGIAWRLYDMQDYVGEACALIRRTIGEQGNEYTAARYGLDDWEITGAREGSLHPAKALAVLRRDNELAEEANASTTD